MSRFLQTLSISCLAAAAIVQAAGAQSATSADLLIPSQFHTAKTAFLAAAGTSSLGTTRLDLQRLTYAGMSAAVAQSYQLKASPAEAELSMRMSVESAFSSVTSGSNFSYFYLRLAIYDTKTGMLLWVLDEKVDPAVREQTAFKNFDLSAAKLAVDLQSLAAGKNPDTDVKSPTKTRFQQDKP